MAGIDAHQHFWNYDPLRDSWITEDMSVIRRDFLPEDLLPLLKQEAIDGSVVVQSDQSLSENIFQLKNAEENEFIKGVVGWVDLRAADISEQLSYYKSFTKMKGFRHVLQGEPQRDLMLTPAFLNGISKLEEYDFTYDILIYPDQLKFIPAFVKQFPQQKFVIDHLAKPVIKKGELSEWKKEMEEMAVYENVYCKISGMVTEADWKEWKQDDFIPYMDTVVNCFGMERLMYGSDWPVCLVAADYTEVINIIRNYFSSFTKSEKENFFGNNAIEFYNLKTN